MIRGFKVILMLCIFPVLAFGSDLEPLLTSSGSDFHKRLEDLAGNTTIVDRLRSAPVDAQGGSDLRFEFLRRLTLARVDAPDEFASFDEAISLVRPDSPLTPGPKWWEGMKDYRQPDEYLLSMIIKKWFQNIPEKDEWPAAFSQSAPQRPLDPRRTSYSCWPPIAYGLTAEPTRLRVVMLPAFNRACSQGGYDESDLEGFLWFCERTSFNPQAVMSYRIAVRIGMSAAKGDVERFVKRELGILIRGDELISVDNKVIVEEYLNEAEIHGDSSDKTVLQQLADNFKWSYYKDDIIDVIQHIDSKNKDKSSVVTRELRLLDPPEDNQLGSMILWVPKFLSDAEIYGMASNAAALRKISQKTDFAQYSNRMLKDADLLDSRGLGFEASPPKH